jgi:hypothetical protein
VRIRKGIATLTLVASGLAPVAQAAPAIGEVAAAQCTAVGGLATKDSQQVTLALHAVYPGAAMVIAGCGIVQHGVTAEYVKAYGVVAATATTATVDGGGWYVCQDTKVVYVDGRIFESNTCP